MRLFVGLGNPGLEYAGHRHNVGFLAVERIARLHGFGPWRRKFQGEIAEGRIGGERIVLLRPLTYMNESGRSVGEAARFFQLEPGGITVFHDEIDLTLGRVRVKVGGGHAGNNGVRSVTQHLGPEFQRVRIGVGHPGDKALVHRHVLSDFAKAERPLVAELIEAIAEAAPKLAAGDAPGFMSAVALKCPPPKLGTKSSGNDSDGD